MASLDLSGAGPRPEAARAETSGRPRVVWVVVCLAALISAIVTFTVYAGHVHDFFIGDDFELIGDALSGVSPLAPVSTHLRPVVRLHFALYRWIPSPAFFGSLSLLLHVLASGAVFRALHVTHGTRVAVPVALLFFGSFLANEAVFWASSSAVLYCMIFCCMALAAFARGRIYASYAWLVPAALSYEMWLVFPFLFLFHFRKGRELIFPFVLAGTYLGLQLLAFGGAGASSYGGFSFAELPTRFSVYAFRLLSPLAGQLSLVAALAVTLLLLALFMLPKMRFAGVLYTGSALVFSLSAFVSARFYYFPSLALILMVVVGVQSTRTPVRLIASLLALYLAVASPWINVLDGEDYGLKAELHESLYDAFSSRIDQVGSGEEVVVVNRLGPEALEALRAQRLGRPKLIYVRGPAMAGMIYPDDAVRMALWERSERPESAACGGRRIEVGRQGSVRSTYCFKVTAR